MINLIEIQSQIQKLQKQASEIRAREFDATVRDILTKMEAFGITLKDLQVKTSARGKGRGREATKTEAKAAIGKNKTVKSPVAAKYRGPNGESWSGRGLTPRWLASLIEQGKSKEDFAIKN
jgi:DNA-binding protein H-NS